MAPYPWALPYYKMGRSGHSFVDEVSLHKITGWNQWQVVRVCHSKCHVVKAVVLQYEHTLTYDKQHLERIKVQSGASSLLDRTSTQNMILFKIAFAGPLWDRGNKGKKVTWWQCEGLLKSDIMFFVEAEISLSLGRFKKPS